MIPLSICSCSGLVRYGVDQTSAMGNNGWTNWRQVGEPNKTSTILCDNDHFGDPNRGADKSCECLEGHFPESISSISNLIFTDQARTMETNGSCCSWRDYSTNEWVPTGESRPCSYEMHGDQVAHFQMGADPPSTLFAQILWAASALSCGCACICCVVALASMCKDTAGQR